MVTYEWTSPKDLHSLSSIVGELYLKTCSIILPILPIASSRPVHSTGTGVPSHHHMSQKLVESIGDCH